MRRTLLLFGILSSILYVAMTVLIPMRWDTYSSASQTISELSAIGAPTRSLWVVPAAFYTVFVIAFGWGVFASAGRNRALRIVGRLIVVYGALGLVWPFAPMHLRETLAAGGGTLSDTMHIALASVTVLLMLIAIGVGSTAFGRRFRVYSIASLIVLAMFGALTFIDAPALATNQPTPWIGVWERINLGVFLLWVVVLAAALWQPRDTAAMIGGIRPRVSSAFKTDKGEAAFLAAYDAALKLWPVPYQEIEIPTPFGPTHVVTSGRADAPPLVLLHGYMATSAMWAPNIVDFASRYRVYALDTMGQPGKSIPGEPIRNAADYAAWLIATLNGLHLDRVSLVGMSYGGWLALNCALRAPDRVERLVLLSPGGGFVPMARQFSVRGLLMMLFPTRFTVNSFMRWLGFKHVAGADDWRVFDLMYLGLKHFRIPPETLRVMPTVCSDDQLAAMRVPTLLLMGEQEVIYDPSAALTRARRLIPNVQGGLVARCSHDMCSSQSRIVDARVLEFLTAGRDIPRRIVA